MVAANLCITTLLPNAITDVSLWVNWPIPVARPRFPDNAEIVFLCDKRLKVLERLGRVATREQALGGQAYLIEARGACLRRHAPLFDR